MIETYLVQRLTKPWSTDFEKKAEQAFGGGALLLKPEAWKLLQDVFGIDYMGAAEYEFGTLPKCLKALAADADKLKMFEITVSAADIAPNWNRQRPARTKRGGLRKKQPVLPPVSDRLVYVICRAEHIEGATDRIRQLAGEKIRTKMAPMVAEALDPIGEHNERIQGWLELDNGFFFFLDKTMWERTGKMLGVGGSDGSEAPKTAGTPV